MPDDKRIAVAIHDCDPDKSGNCGFYGIPLAACLAAQKAALVANRDELVRERDEWKTAARKANISVVDTMKERDALRAENERLRVGLTRIVGMKYAEDDWDEPGLEAQEIANETLRTEADAAAALEAR